MYRAKVLLWLGSEPDYPVLKVTGSKHGGREESVE